MCNHKKFGNFWNSGRLCFVISTWSIWTNWKTLWFLWNGVAAPGHRCSPLQRLGPRSTGQTFPQRAHPSVTTVLLCTRMSFRPHWHTRDGHARDAPLAPTSRPTDTVIVVTSRRPRVPASVLSVGRWISYTNTTSTITIRKLVSKGVIHHRYH
jgi:hypothetical protein